MVEGVYGKVLEGGYGKVLEGVYGKEEEGCMVEWWKRRIITGTWKVYGGVVEGMYGQMVDGKWMVEWWKGWKVRWWVEGVNGRVVEGCMVEWRKGVW